MFKPEEGYEYRKEIFTLKFMREVFQRNKEDGFVPCDDVLNKPCEHCEHIVVYFKKKIE